MSQSDPPTLGLVAASELDEARLQIHWAIQILAAVGDALVEHRDDDSHSNLEWLTGEGRFAGHPASRPPCTRAALRLADLTLQVLDEEGAAAASLRLTGRRLDDGLGWMGRTIERLRGTQPTAALRLRDYDMPSHPVAEGAGFEIRAPMAFAEAAAWYESGDRILRRLAARRLDAARVRCWPHHFDLATLLELAPHEGLEEAKSVGIGMLLGDRSYDEPYWYVNCWPAPEDPATPPLAAGGHWHTEGFFAAVLTASRLVGAGSGVEQERRVEAFLASALEAVAHLRLRGP